MNNNIKNNRPLILRALALEKVERVPLWMMRQAGRYLPEYQKVRKSAGSFLNLCKNPEFACEVTMQPIERFKLDAAILFSDILVIPDALGLGLEFSEGEGPWLQRPLVDEKAIATIQEFDVTKLSYQHEAIKACKQALDPSTPLIGFCGGPFTLACYMIDGRGGQFLETRRMLYQRPDLFQQIIDVNVNAAAECLNAQAKAGCDILMMFESWAALAPKNVAKQCLINPLKKIVEAVRAKNNAQPVIVFLRNASDLSQQAVDAKVSCLGVDWRTDLKALSEKFKGQVALQGNLDPAVLLSDPKTVEKKVIEVLNSCQADTGHIFNLGHGIDKHTPIENVEALVAAVAKHSTKDILAKQKS